MPQPKVQGRFVWEELLTANPASAVQFYPKVVGWQLEDSPFDPVYKMFMARTGLVAGMVELGEETRASGARAHWLPYIGAQDVDATVAAAERLGGRTLKAASTIGGVGRYAVLADPGGASFGVYAPERLEDRQGTPNPGEFSWHELATGDIEAAFDFYRELFGWQVMQRMNMGPAGTYLIFGWDGVQRGGIYKLTERSPVPYWLAYVAVPDADVAVQTALAAGGRVAVGPMDVPGGGRIAQLLDPSEVLFAVHSQLRAAASAGAEPPARPATRPVRRPVSPATTAASVPAATVASAAQSSAPKTPPLPSRSAPSVRSRVPQGAAPAGARSKAARRPGKTRKASKAGKVAAKANAKAKAGRKTARRAVKKTAKKARTTASRALVRRGAERRRAQAARRSRARPARRARPAAARRKAAKRGAAKSATRRRATAGRARGSRRGSAARRRRR